jgi:uncharacterized protein with HEPN domain
MSQDELRDQGTVADILGAARLAIEFLGGLDEDGFYDDPKTQSSVIHQILIVGEAVKRLSFAFREVHREIPWQAMAGMRDQLIHAYHEVDLSEVWKTVTFDLPALVQRLEQLRQAG